MPDFKITADHIRRDAYLYVRQSTLRQVAENGESTQTLGSTYASESASCACSS
jgi:hypothetical protein